MNEREIIRKILFEMFDERYKQDKIRFNKMKEYLEGKTFLGLKILDIKFGREVSNDNDYYITVLIEPPKSPQPWIIRNQIGGQIKEISKYFSLNHISIIPTFNPNNLEHTV